MATLGLLSDPKRRAADLHKRMRHEHAKLTTEAREAIKRLGIKGFSDAASLIRAAGVTERIGRIGHTQDYVEAVLGAVSKVMGDEGDVRKFVRHFTAKDPVFSNSDVGMAAIQFEAWLIDNNNLAFDQLIETVAEPGAPDFLAIFQGNIVKEVWERVVEGTQKFVTLKHLVRAGEQSSTEHERSDVTIVQGLPVKGYDPKKEDNQLVNPLPIPPGGKAITMRESVEEALKLGTKDPATMTAPQINKELDKLDQLSSETTDALIAAGRGTEMSSETFTKSDPLANDFKAIYHRRMALRIEVEQRYGGRIHRLPTGKVFGPRKQQEDDEDANDPIDPKAFSEHLAQHGIPDFDYHGWVRTDDDAVEMAWIDPQSNRIDVTLKETDRGYQLQVVHHDYQTKTPTLLHENPLVTTEELKDPSTILPVQQAEAFDNSRHLPFVQYEQNITSRYGTWRIETDPNDNDKVNILFGEPRKAFSLNHNIEEAKALLNDIANSYENLTPEFDLMAEHVLREFAEDEGKETTERDYATEQRTDAAQRVLAYLKQNAEGTTIQRLKAKVAKHGNTDEGDRIPGGLLAQTLKGLEKAGKVTKRMEGNKGWHFYFKEDETEGGEGNDATETSVVEGAALKATGGFSENRNATIFQRNSLRLLALNERQKAHTFARSVMFNRGHKRHKKRGLKRMNRQSTVLGSLRARFEGLDYGPVIDAASLDESTIRMTFDNRDAGEAAQDIALNQFPGKCNTELKTRGDVTTLQLSGPKASAATAALKAAGKAGTVVESEDNDAASIPEPYTPTERFLFAEKHAVSIGTSIMLHGQHVGTVTQCEQVGERFKVTVAPVSEEGAVILRNVHNGEPIGEGVDFDGELEGLTEDEQQEILDWFDDKLNEDNPTGLLRNRRRALRNQPDAYRQQVGKCPTGFHYGSNTGRCVPNREVRGIVRQVAKDVKAGVRALGTEKGQHAVLHTAKHLGKEIAGLAMLPVHVATGAYKLAFKPAVRKALVKKFTSVVKQEAKETVAMVKTVGKMVSGGETTHEERVAAVNQAVDLVKVGAASAIVGTWAAGGLAELAKELAMPWDDLAGSLVDKPLRAITERYLGSGSVHGLLPSAFYAKESLDEAKEHDATAQVLTALASLAGAHRPSLADLREALTGKVPADKLEKFLEAAKSKHLAEALYYEPILVSAALLEDETLPPEGMLPLDELFGLGKTLHQQAAVRAHDYFKKPEHAQFISDFKKSVRKRLNDQTHNTPTMYLHARKLHKRGITDPHQAAKHYVAHLYKRQGQAVPRNMESTSDGVLKSKPKFDNEKEAIRDAKGVLGPKAKKGRTFTTYTEGGKWGWINSDRPWMKEGDFGTWTLAEDTTAITQLTEAVNDAASLIYLGEAVKADDKPAVTTLFERFLTYGEIGHDKGGSLWAWNAGKLDVVGNGIDDNHEDHWPVKGDDGLRVYGRVDPSRKLVSVYYHNPVSGTLEDKIESQLARKYPEYKLVRFRRGTSTSDAGVFVEGEILERFATSGPGEKVEPLRKQFDRWIRDGDNFRPSGPVRIEHGLGKFSYNATTDMWGNPVFVRVRPQTDELYRFENTVMEHVLTAIDKFWSSREDYDKFKAMYNRGVLLYGPPGSGKSSIVHQVAEQIIERGDVVFYSRELHSLRKCLEAVREIEPDRRMMVILEDADEFLRGSEREFLQLLDGETSVTNVLYLATTNYLERFPPRLLRPGRFDEHVYVPHPPRAGRVEYLRRKLAVVSEDADAIENLADETDGMSFGHLRELILAHYVLKQPLEDVLARLRKTITAGIPESHEVIILPQGAAAGYAAVTGLAEHQVVKSLSRGILTLHEGRIEPRGQSVMEAVPKVMAALDEHAEAGMLDEASLEIITDDPAIAQAVMDYLRSKGVLRKDADDTKDRPETEEELNERADAEVNDATSLLTEEKFDVCISKYYFPREKWPSGVQEYFKQYKVTAATRTDAAKKVWEQHKDELLAIMNPPTSALPRKVSLHVGDNITPPGRQQPILVVGEGLTEDANEAEYVGTSGHGSQVVAKRSSNGKLTHVLCAPRNRPKWVRVDALGGNDVLTYEADDAMDAADAHPGAEVADLDEVPRMHAEPAFEVTEGSKPRALTVHVKGEENAKAFVNSLPASVGSHTYGGAMNDKTVMTVSLNVSKSADYDKVKAIIAKHPDTKLAHGSLAHEPKTGRTVPPEGLKDEVTHGDNKPFSLVPAGGKFAGKFKLVQPAKQFKTRVDTLADFVGGYYSHRAGTILSAKQATRLVRLLDTGHDASSFSGQLEDPDPKLAKPEAGGGGGGKEDAATKVAKVFAAAKGMPDYEAASQGAKDWASGKAYLDNAGNYRLHSDKAGSTALGKNKGKGAIAPWNKVVKSIHPDNASFHAHAMKFYGPKGSDAASSNGDKPQPSDKGGPIIKDKKTGKKGQWITRNGAHVFVAEAGTTFDMPDETGEETTPVPFQQAIQSVMSEAGWTEDAAGVYVSWKYPGVGVTVGETELFFSGVNERAILKARKELFADSPLDEEDDAMPLDPEALTDRLALQDGNVLDEMSMSRILSHTTKGNGYAILSADRSERSPKENAQHRAEVEKHLRSIGKGFTKVKGGYVEKTAGGNRPVYEHSYMVHNVNHKEAANLARHMADKHQQDAVLHVHPHAGANLHYGKEGKTEHVGDSFTASAHQQYFTEWHRRRFGFKAKAAAGAQRLAASVGGEGDPEVFTAYIPSGQIDAMTWASALASVVEDDAPLFTIKDVQQYFDMQILAGETDRTAMKLTKEKFKLTTLEVGPNYRVASPDVPDPKNDPTDTFPDDAGEPDPNDPANPNNPTPAQQIAVDPSLAPEPPASAVKK